MTHALHRRLARAWPLVLACAGPPASGQAAPIAAFSDFRYEGRQPAHARAPLGPGQYRNPIVQGSYSDLSIVRVGRDYFMANASFTLFPGGPIFRSRDLVHWKQVGSAIQRPEQLDFSALDTWQGDYANDLKHHDGVFYYTSTCYACGGPFLMTARKPAGPWSEPVWLPIDGIDTSIFFDDDGRAYVLISGPPQGGAKWDGHRTIWLQELNLRTLKLVGERRVLVDGGSYPARKPFWLEGPHLLKHDGRYILICAEGGTKERHTEVAFGSDTLLGPYAPAPGNPILSQLDLDPARPDPVVQTGHADFVQTPAGDWWAVFLGSRPWSASELDYNTGRETFLLPVAWRDGWPSILPPRAPVPLVAPRPELAYAPTGEPHAGDYLITEGFNTPRLDPRWSTVRTQREAWWRTGGGTLRITARPEALGGAGQPSLLAIRQQHMDFAAKAALRFMPEREGDEAGLTAFQGMRRFFTLSVAGAPGGGREVRLERMAGKDDPETGSLVARAPLAEAARDAPVRLEIEAAGPRHRFFYAEGRGAWRQLGPDQDGAILAISSSKGFTGTLIGLYAYAAPRKVAGSPPAP